MKAIILAVLLASYTGPKYPTPESVGWHITCRAITEEGKIFTLLDKQVFEADQTKVAGKSAIRYRDAKGVHDFVIPDNALCISKELVVYRGKA